MSSEQTPGQPADLAALRAAALATKKQAEDAAAALLAADPTSDAMLYYIVLEFSMNSIWIVLTITTILTACKG